MSEPRPFGLALRSPRSALAASALTFVVLVATTSRSIGLFDEGELAVAAYELGLGHPVGQPIHTLLGFVFAHLPGLAPSHGLAILSALAAALSVIPAIALVERHLPSDARPFVAWSTVVTIALHPVMWEASTRIEVYPLAILFALLAVAHAAASEPDAIRVGAFVGLAASANPVIATVALVCSLVVATIPRASVPRAVGRGLVGLLFGLLPYAYLGVAAMRTHAFVWGGLASTDELTHYLLGKDYGGNLGVDMATRVSHVRELVVHLAGERTCAALLVTAMLGLGALAMRSGRAAVAVILGFSLPLVFVASNRVFAVDVPDYLGYLGFGFTLLALPVAAAIDAAQRHSKVSSLLVVALVGAALLAPPFVVGRSRASDDVTERLAREVLDESPHRSIVVLESDHLVAPILYLQRVERVRPDVVVVIRGLMASSWYIRMLHAQHPSLRDFAIRGRGGRDARIRRLVDANRPRTVRVEHLGIATALGLVACPSGIAFAVRDRCDAEADRPNLGPVIGIFAHAHRLPAGAIDGHQVVSAVGLRLALELERFGDNRAAYTVLVASLPDGYRGRFLPPPSSVVDGRPLTTPDPAFARARALGEPARNAFVAARMLAGANQIDAAIELTRRAASDGLPEAIDLLARASATR